ncbi:MAG: BatD family protein [Dysgonamonadaceae bacterium]|jgi:hypothetical protein|nr:BatD family protein [Dysgonamonadaceae bacterium]
MRYKVLLFMILCLDALTIFAQDVTFKVSVERTVVANQKFQITYTLTTKNGAKGQNFQPPSSFGDLNILFGPTQQYQSSSSVINNIVTTTIIQQFIYVATAPKEGEYTIGAATIKIGNSEYKTEPLIIKALPPEKTAPAQTGDASGNESSGRQTNAISTEDMFIRAVPSKTSVYENEGFLITFKLYSKYTNLQFESFNFPEYEGFIAQEIETGSAQWSNIEQYNGQNYRTAILKQTFLFPQHSGKITISSGKFNLVAAIPSGRKTSSIFDPFISSVEQVRKSLSSSTVTINVKELPSGKPASFNGAVGDYKMTSSISRTDLKANDAVTVKVTITGAGNMKLLKNPEIVFPNDFEIYDPVVNTASKVSQSGVNGSRTIEYNAIPRYAGDFTIPKTEFSYFDLKSGTYKTLNTSEYSLHVAQGEGGNILAPVINATNKETLRLLGQDIHYIKTGNITFISGVHFFGTWGYALWYIIPSLLFIVLFIIYRKQAAENANIALVRTKKANKMASKRLKMTAIYLKENKQEAFYDEILKAVWGYLSDKLSISVASLTKDNVEANLTEYGANEILINNFRDILNTAEFARFAPAQSSGAMDELYNKTVQAIDLMENTIK